MITLYFLMGVATATAYRLFQNEKQQIGDMLFIALFWPVYWFISFIILILETLTKEL